MNRLGLEAHREGTVLPIRARAGARHNGIRAQPAGRLQVSVTQAPERGKANQAIAALLAKTLGLRKAQIELIAGPTSPQKRFLVRDVAPAELQARIEQALVPRDEDGGGPA